MNPCRTDAQPHHWPVVGPQLVQDRSGLGDQPDQQARLLVKR